MNPSHDIAVFIRVVDLGSFAAVAKEANLSPSAVSKIVSRLEDRLGVKLLQRTTRRLVLSQEGETYSIRGREILAAIEAAEAEVTAGRGQPRGHLRINTGTAFAKHRLAPLLPEFLKKYPDMTVELSVTDRRVDVVAEQVDVAIRVGPLGDTSLVTHRLGEVRRIIAASPAYLRRHGTPKQARDLLSHNCLHLRGFSRLAGWPMYVNGERVLLPVTGSMSSDSADLLLDLAVSGIGIVRLGDFLGEAALSAKQLVPLLETCHDDDPTPLNALMPPGRQNIPRVRAFVDFLDGKLRTANQRSIRG
ncbi:LysR family transcriptional regulator [Bradyrhizobium sediminis]|uniref:LysR family transcriptional regulator n=1 Tax=Bradyrhizobium sediminis TaxID=2840469 RepID=A0A975NG85_9BRAD|nr:LysR family transcriptional regulator [Bradyrhizobium sediminis]QWG14260.1 LysR family transcriptional regulator [Bradyrhizobium sediminis]